MTKTAGSGSRSGSGSTILRHGSADPDPNPDPHQNVMDPQHCDLDAFICKTGNERDQLQLVVILGIIKAQSLLSSLLLGQKIKQA
jgi:hypothetical protein